MHGVLYYCNSNHSILQLAVHNGCQFSIMYMHKCSLLPLSATVKNAIFIKYYSFTKGDAPVELYTDISVFGLRSIYIVVRNKIDLTYICKTISASLIQIYIIILYVLGVSDMLCSLVDFFWLFLLYMPTSYRCQQRHIEASAQVSHQKW